MFTVEELARLMECSVNAIYKRVRKGTGPKPKRVGGKLFFSIAAVWPYVLAKRDKEKPYEPAKWKRKRLKKRGPKPRRKRLTTAQRKAIAWDAFQELKQRQVERKS